MTQIKLRRDTSANFTSKNPVLGVGEPAYETDTKKLKIGDGTTAYTQLEYFSAGGGGSTDISATLPLKIVDGVISLEVDGQTIQIVDGKLHANLDELGNKVNSLTGEVTDLSGRVTAVEADILTKENKITTTGALSLQEKIISNLTNMTETETQITPNKEQDFVVNQNEFYFANTTYNTPLCYIAIPYQFGQWLKIPGGYDIRPSVFFGHFLEDGDFLITAVFSGNCYERNYPIYGGIVRGTAPVSFSSYSGSIYLNSYGSVSEKAMNSNIIFTETDPCAYLQLIDNTSNNNIICGSYNYGYGPNNYSIKGYGETHVVYNRDLTSYTVQDFVRDTTTALIMSPSASYPILKSAVGLYAATGRLGWNQEGYNQLKANLGENLFDLTKSQVNNYLELNTDSSLVVNSEGKLGLSSPTPTKTSDLTNDSGFITAIPTASANTLGGIKVGDNLSITEDGTLSATGGGSAPANMVTTDTAQTITGIKTFGGTDLSKILLEGSESLISFRQNSDSLPTTLIGGFFDSNGKKSITIGSKDHETLSLNAKSVQDGSGNKFLTSGNVTAYITKTYVNGTSGYRIWSDGYCEQWGQNSGATNAETALLKQYSDTTYNISLTFDDSPNGNRNADNRTKYIAAYDATKFYVRQYNDAGNAFHWKTCGYLAQGQY